MRWTLISCKSKSKDTPPIRTILGLFPNYFQDLLTHSAVDEDLSELSQVQAYDESAFQSDPFKNENCSWESYLVDLFLNWYQLHFREGGASTHFSIQEIDLIVRKFCSVVLRNQASFFNVPQNFSLFLSITTEAQGLKLRGFRDFGYTIGDIQNRYSNFLNDVATWIPKRILLDRAQHFGVRVAFRYFAFEFLRRYPAASEELSKTYGWNFQQPIYDILESWKESYVFRNCQQGINIPFRRQLFEALKTNIRFFNWKELLKRMDSFFELETNKQIFDFYSFMHFQWRKLQSLLWDCYQPYFDSFQERSEKEMVSLITNFYHILADRADHDFGSPRAFSLFLAVMTEPRINKVLELDRQLYPEFDAHIFEVMKKVNEMYPKFLKSLEDWTMKCHPSRDPNHSYASAIGFRYFLFELLREYPVASQHFQQTLGWESERPAQSIWKLWRESINQKIVSEKCKKALTIWKALNLRSTVPSRTIPVMLFKLFSTILKMTPLTYWKPNLMETWEGILFRDKSLLDIGPISEDSIQSALAFIQKSKRNVTRCRAQFLLDEDWPLKVWPEVLSGCRPETENSDDWILVLSIASLGWYEITGDMAWKIAASNHPKFWNFIWKIERSIDNPVLHEKSAAVVPFGHRSSAIERITRRYLVLQALKKGSDLNKYGIVWNDVSRSMWEDTEKLHSQSADEKTVASGSTGLMSREQFRLLIRNALDLIKEREGNLCVDEEFLKAAIMDEIFTPAMTELEDGPDWLDNYISEVSKDFLSVISNDNDSEY